MAMPSRKWLVFALAFGFSASMQSGYACNDYYVCAPNDPFRHTVESANFTNLYLYPNPRDMTWDQYTAQSLKQADGQPAMTVQAIDGFVQSLTQDSSYFFPATQYHLINLPRFSGHQNTVQSCVDPVMAYARSHNNVLSREILADFVGCERGAGGNSSDQINIIMSPEFRATNDAHTNILGVTLDLSDQPATCPPSKVGAFHTWQFGTANFTVIPTMCNATMDALAISLSHEMIELMSDPAGVGYVHMDGGGDQIVAIGRGQTDFLNSGELSDICELGGPKNPARDPSIAYVAMPHSSLRVSRYWSNSDNSCQPQYMVSSQDILVDDRRSLRLGTGDGMTSDLSYGRPFLHGQPSQPLEHLVVYTETNDDNLCHQSSLDFHVNLTGGRHSLDFFHINNVQYAGSWDNHEQHAVNIPVPAGLRLSDIDSFNIHVHSGHCNGLFTDGDDGWNVSRIAIFAYLVPIEPPPHPHPFPPQAPSGCKVYGGSGLCGQVDFNCDPFSAADTMVVGAAGIGVRVTGTEPRIGMILGDYLNQGNATVTVCATRAGLVACGNPIPNVSFGPTSCPFGPPPHRVCPTGLVQCQGGCRPFNDPECHRM
jgi:hypothetical protein